MPDTFASEKVVIQNSAGFHVRPITAFVQTALKYKSEIRIKYNGQTVNGKSPLECTMLAAPFGAEFVIEAEGEDAQEAIKELTKLVKNKFGIQ